MKYGAHALRSMIGGIVAAAAVLAVVGLWLGSVSVSAQSQPSGGIGSAVSQAELSKWASVGGERFVQSLPPTGDISSEEAIADAEKVFFPGPNSPVLAARFGIFSNDHQYRMVSGTRVFTLRDRAAWIVRFSNVSKPLFGHVGSEVGIYNVVIDATDGSYIGGFMVG